MLICCETVMKREIRIYRKLPIEDGTTTGLPIKGNCTSYSSKPRMISLLPNAT
jgi:hypothetical protein